MKKLFIGLAFLLAVITVFAANQRVKTTKQATVYAAKGDVSYIEFGGAAGDTIVVSDTVTYITPIEHVGPLVPYFVSYLQKIGAGTATITINYLQSNDGIKYYPIKKGKLKTDYTKSVTVSATAWDEGNFANDTVVVEGRYLKKQYITSSTASVKVKITNKVKFNTK